MDNPFVDAQDISAQSSNNTNPFVDTPQEQGGVQASDTQSSPFVNNNDIPVDVRSADQLTGSDDDNGLCETFVEQLSGLPQMGATAKDAWNNWQSQGKATKGLNGIQTGDILYFDANGGNNDDGHAAIFAGYDNKGDPLMVSATYQGVRKDNVNEWSQNQAPLLGYVHP